MKLAIFNGSPRGNNSNTKILLEHFREGFEHNGGEMISMDFLIKQKHLDEQILHFKEAENIFIAFPLYVDSVPGIVKKFIENIGNFNGSGKKILFMVQSGFPEGVHSEEVKRYLQLLAKRWKMECLGVIVKGGVEGIQIMPEMMTQKLFNKLHSFGVQLVLKGELNHKDLNDLAKPYKFSKFRILLFRFMQFTGMANFYWNKKLKEHGAFKQRFNAPYL